MVKKILKISNIVILALLGVLLLLEIGGYFFNVWLFSILLGVLLLLNKIGRKILTALLGLVLLVWLLIQTGPVQNFIIGKITSRLSRDLNAEVNIQHVSFSLFDKMDLNGALIRDRQKDTLLYAGTLKLRINDWFFLKNNTDLKYIGLEDAVIRMHRRDTVWNFQFIIDHFSSPQAKDTASKPIVLNIQKIDLKKVSFIKDDEWRGEKMVLKVGSMLLDAKKTDINRNEFLVDSIELDRPYFSIENYEGRRPKLPAHMNSEEDTGMYFNSGNILLKIGVIKITNGAFASFKRGEIPDKGVFDGMDIRVSKINGTLSALNFIKDTIRAKINLSASERSGFELKKLKAAFRLTPQIMEFANLDLRTPRSRVGNYYAMRYRDFNDDMGEYIDRVVMDAHFKNSEVASDDIAYFAPALSSWNQLALFSGKYHGTVSNFKVDNFFIRTTANTYASGDFAMKGLADIDKTTMVLSNAIVQANNQDIAFLYPDIKDIKTPDLKELGNIRFQGSFAGTVHDFTTKGNISTQLGGAYTDINLKLPEKGEPSYKGNIETQQFNLGKFLDVGSIGKASFKGSIEGKSFNIKKAKVKLAGDFSTFEFNGYAYSNLQCDGAIQTRKFTGDFKASDPNFDFTSSIEVDFTGRQPSFNILGDLANANLKKLNLIQKNFQLTGLFDLNFTGRNIDEFMGSAKILNATLKHDSTRLDFDSLTVSASVDPLVKKVLSLQSNQFDVTVLGQFNILDLPQSFQFFLTRYYPAYINPVKSVPTNQHFIVEVNTRNFDKYANVIDPRLSGLDNMKIVGGVNTDGKDSGFYINASIPFAKFERYKLENAQIVGLGGLDSLTVSGDIGRVYVGDSLFFPNSKLNIHSSNDHSRVHISTSANETLNDADINAEVVTLEDGVRINFQPSSFVMNTKKWELEKEGELMIRKTFASARNVKFSQGFQEITVGTEEEDGSNTSNLVVKLKNVNMGDFIPLFTKNPRMEGLVNGNVYLRDFYNRFNADANIQADQFRLNDDSVGVVNVTANYNSETGKVHYTVKSDNKNYVLDALGFYNIKDSIGMPLSTTIHLNGTKVNFINQFLSDLFTDIDGLATGDLTVQGDPQSPDLLGKITLRNAAITVNYTKVRYTIDSAYFVFNDGSIDFGKFTIKDRYNNKGSIRGILYEKGFKNMRYDFDMNTEKLLLLDTKEKDNTAFYGKAIGRATLSLKGPQENMRMSIAGEVNDTTRIFLPSSTSKESSDADFIVFKKYGEEQKQVNTPNTNFSIDLDLIANNKARIDVILDELTGDVISATGNGRIKINVPAKGNMTMNGRYNIESGNYNFNFQSFIHKPFELRKNAGNYIEWTGDPYKAQMHVDAQYTAKNVGFADLVSNTGYDIGGSARAYRGEVYVVAHLTGKLMNPDIKFSFDFPPGGPVETNDYLRLFLIKVQGDDNEMLKQVTWLIVFGSFAPYGELGTGGTAAKSAGINTISLQITNELNKMISNLLFKVTGDKSLQFDVSTSTYSSASMYYNTTSTTQSNQLDRQQINLKVNQSLLNGNIIVTFGTGLDFNISSSAVQTGNLQWLPDISVQFILSRDRKLRAIVFNKSSLDVSTNGYIGKRTRQGVSIAYTFDFPKDSKPHIKDTLTKQPVGVKDSASQ